jgi:hypothetical protein
VSETTAASDPGTAGQPGAAGDHGEAALRMRAIAAGLRAAGLTARLHRSRAGWDITAVLARSGGRESEVVIDEDGYTEIRYWNPPGATPDQIARVIAGALAVIHDCQHRAGR